MRLKISLTSNNGNYLIPYNYNHILSAIIYRKIADLDLAAKLHFSKDFKFFTFPRSIFLIGNALKRVLFLRMENFPFTFHLPTNS